MEALELKIKNAFESKQISNSDDLSGADTAGLTNEIAQIQKEKKHKQELMTQLQIVEQQIHQKMVQRVNESILANPGIGDPILDPKNLVQGHPDHSVGMHLNNSFAQQARPMPDGNPAPLEQQQQQLQNQQQQQPEPMTDATAPPPSFNYHREVNQEYDQETIDQETIKVRSPKGSDQVNKGSVYSEHARIHAEPRHSQLLGHQLHQEGMGIHSN